MSWNLIFILFLLILPVLRVETMTSALKEDEWWSAVSTSYLSYDQLTLLLQDMETTYPTLVRRYSLGKSVEEREMWALNLRMDVDRPRPLLVPPMKLVANIHGDESVGRSLLLMFAVDLLRHYNTDGDTSTVRLLLQYTDIHLVPSLNPDGYEAAHKLYSEKENCFPDGYITGRQNANQRDLNRNFPDQFDEVVFEPEPETKHIINYILSESFVLSVSFHGGAWVASYPFDSTPLRQERCSTRIGSYSPDQETFVILAKLYSQHHTFMATTLPYRCTYDRDKKALIELFEDGITNGAAWFNVYGGMQDYNYAHSNCFEFTAEVTCCKFPAASTLLEEWEANRRALLKITLATHMGIRGIAYSSSGEILKNASLRIDGVKHSIRTTERGEFWRLTPPGKVRYKFFWKDINGHPQESDFLHQTARKPPSLNATEEELKPLPSQYKPKPTRKPKKSGGGGSLKSGGRINHFIQLILTFVYFQCEMLRL